MDKAAVSSEAEFVRWDIQTGATRCIPSDSSSRELFLPVGGIWIGISERFSPLKRFHSETRVLDWISMKIFRQPNSSIASPARFRTVYELNRLPVFRYVYALTGGSQDDAEDLAAETFLRAWKARHQFHGEREAAIAWLIGIAKRLVIDDHRRTARATRNLPTDLDTESTPEQIAINDEQERILFRLVADLPDEQREIIVLRHLLGWRVNDIAKHLGVSENKISVSLHRTLSKLREKWMEIDSKNPSAIFIQKETTYEPHT
jgi:RNA polymerase sigma-70 factor (ECF subfamily)